MGLRTHRCEVPEGEGGGQDAEGAFGEAAKLRCEVHLGAGLLRKHDGVPREDLPCGVLRQGEVETSARTYLALGALVPFTGLMAPSMGLPQAAPSGGGI